MSWGGWPEQQRLGPRPGSGEALFPACAHLAESERAREQAPGRLISGSTTPVTGAPPSRLHQTPITSQGPTSSHHHVGG